MVTPDGTVELRLTETLNRFPQLRQQLKELSDVSIFVGVTEETAGQSVLEGQINNAVKAYLNDNGAPEVNIPQREFMRPGVKAAEAQILKALRKSAKAMLNDDARGVEAGLERAGLEAQAGIVNEIDSGPLDPGTRTLSPVTIANRKRGRGPDRPPRDSEEPLLESGALRQSITYVVEK